MFFQKINSIFYYLFQFWYYKMIFGKIGYKTRIYGFLKIVKPQNIFLGKKVYIGKLTWLEANPLTDTKNCSLTIDDNTYIGNFAHIFSTSNIYIGKKVLIADKVYISDNLRSYQDINIPVIDQPIKQLKPVQIGSGSWIGEGVSIIGASVGRHSIIGANSVVTKDIPEYCIAVGTPAKIIKRYSFERNDWFKTNEKGDFIFD
jgi:acetyltransferase-like isoleucine patch superfamily enzyme